MKPTLLTLQYLYSFSYRPGIRKANIGIQYRQISSRNQLIFTYLESQNKYDNYINSLNPVLADNPV